MASMTVEYRKGEQFAKIVFVDNERGELDFCGGQSKNMTESEFDMLVAAEGDRVPGWKADWH